MAVYLPVWIIVAFLFAFNVKLFRLSAFYLKSIYRLFVVTSSNDNVILPGTEVEIMSWKLVFLKSNFLVKLYNSLYKQSLSLYWAFCYRSNFAKILNYFFLHFVITTVRKEMQQRLKLFCGFCWKTNRSE